MANRYKYITGLIFFLLISLATEGQHTYPFFESKAEPEAFFNYHTKFEANTLPANFIKTVYRGEFLNEKIKSDALECLQDEGNMAGFRQNSEFRIVFPLRDTSWNTTIAYTTNTLNEITFSSSSFDLAFFGNHESIGEDYPFSIRYRSLKYESFHLGIRKQWDKQFAGIELGFVDGLHFLDANVKDAGIYTAEDGSYIELKMKAEIIQSSENSKSNRLSGTGGSFDLFWGLRTPKRHLLIHLDDFGLVRFPDNDIKGKTDTSWRYDGINYDFFGEKDKVFFSVNRDSLKKWSGIDKGGSHTFFLPSSLNLAIEQKFHNKTYSLGFSGRYSFYSMASPRITVRPGFRIHPRWKLSATFTHGGYCSLRPGLHIATELPWDLRLKLGSYNLTGLAINNSPAGADFYVTLFKH